MYGQSDTRSLLNLFEKSQIFGNEVPRDKHSRNHLETLHWENILPSHEFSEILDESKFKEYEKIIREELK